MVERLTATCDAFALVIDVPRRGDRELHLEVTFAPVGTVDGAPVELRLFARKVSGALRAATHWDTEAAVPGTKALLERGQTGVVRFERPLPPFVTGFRGTGLEITPAVVVEGADGSRLAVLVDAAPVAGDARLVVRGLPLEETLSSGLVRGLRRRTRGLVTVEEAGTGSIAITVQADKPISGGRVRLEALEYERDHGSHFDWSPPITAVDVPLIPIDLHLVRAEVRLPDATTAPASIECTWAARRQGVRWLARVDLEDERAKLTSASVPLHVGVERDS